MVPAEIAGLGSTAQKLRVASGFDPLKAGVGPEEYFVLSRIDGTQTLRDILLTTGLPLDRAIAILTRLRAIGALVGPDEAPPNLARGTGSRVGLDAPARARTSTPPTGSPVTARTQTPMSTPQPGRAPTPAPVISRTMTPMAARSTRTPLGTGAETEPPERVLDLSLPNLTAEERAVLAEPCGLDDTERRRVLALARLVRAGDPHAILGVAVGADKKALKRAYFKLSKDIHPDRYYGKQLGSFGPRLELVFEAVSRAYAKLTDGDGRRAPTPPPTGGAVAVDEPQSPQEYAAELFEHACATEVGGDPLQAMKLFAAAIRVDPQVRYLRRGATCALAAQQPKTALEYAKKAQALAPEDASALRLLAACMRASGKLADAEEVLVMAMAVKSENDVLVRELRNDLAEVRRLIAQG